MKTLIVCIAVVLAAAAGPAWAADEAGKGSAALGGGAACGDPCCADVCCPTGTARTGCGFVAGVEATFLRPNIKNDDIAFTIDGYEPLTSSSLAKFDELQGAPRIWIGFEGDYGWGLRARFWDFNSSNVGAETDLGTEVDDIHFENIATRQANLSLDAYTFDLEITKRFCGDPWEVLFGGGVRYAHREINSTYYFFDHFNRFSTFTSLTDKTGGIGLTGVIEGARRLGDSHFSLIGSLRGSVVWGDKYNNYTGAMHTDGIALSQVALLTGPATTYILDLQVGVRWERRIECLCGSVFSQVAFEYQWWDTDACAGVDFAQVMGNVATTGSMLDHDVEFIGLAWAIGFKH